MTRWKRILKDYQESGALNAHVNILAAVDDHFFLTKTGDLAAFFAVHGVDSECLDASQLDHLARAFESALGTFDEHYRVYQYLIKTECPAIPQDPCGSPIAQEAVQARTAYLQNKELCSFEIYMAVVYSGWQSRSRRWSSDWKHPQRACREMLSMRTRITVLDEELTRARTAFRQKLTGFIAQLRDHLGIELLAKQRAFRFLRRLLNYDPSKAEAVSLKYDEFVDFQLCSSTLQCESNRLRLDDYHVQALSLKEPPAQTVAHLFQGIEEIPSNAILVSEWRRESAWKIRRLIESKRRHFHHAKVSLTNYLPSQDASQPKDMLVDDSAVARVRELGAALEEVEVKGRAFGEFSLVAVLYDQDFARLRRSVTECFKLFAKQDAQLIEERYNLPNAFLSALPGNGHYNLRRLWLLDSNAADLAFLYAPRTGEKRNRHLDAEYLVALETNQKTPFYLNLHYQDRAHALMMGATGAGKSFGLNLLVTHAQKYAPRTRIFDLGGSYEQVTKLFGGAYLRMSLENRQFTINPFVLPPTPENLQALFSFVKVLIESSYAMTGQDDGDLWAQLENLYVLEPEHRRLATLSRMLNRRLRLALEKWIEDGQYGGWFDNAQDTLTFAPFQAIDFEGMEKVPELLEPLLFYLLHRANAIVYDETLATTLKLFLLDEAWRFFRHAVTRNYIQESLKVWRKRNAAMILATQSSEDLLRSEILGTIVESCATKLFLANPDIDQALYRDIFHLNETEAAWIAKLQPKQQMLLKRPDGSKVLNLNVEPKSYWLYTSSPRERERRRAAFEQHGFEKGLELLARSTS